MPGCEHCGFKYSFAPNGKCPRCKKPVASIYRKINTANNKVCSCDLCNKDLTGHYRWDTYSHHGWATVCHRCWFKLTGGRMGIGIAQMFDPNGRCIAGNISTHYGEDQS